MQYRYNSPPFKFMDTEPSQITCKMKVTTYEESIEIKNEHIFQQLNNDMYEKIENGECFSFKFIEESLIRNMLSKYNRTNSAKILGISVRTLRNKINEYGLKEVQPNSSILH